MTVVEKSLPYFPFLRELSDASVELINNESELVSFTSGTEIINRGDRLESAYLITNGSVDVYLINESGKEVTLHRVGGGQSCLFALDAVFSDKLYPAWARVGNGDAILMAIPLSVAKQLHNTEIAFRNWVFQMQSKRIEELVGTLEEMLSLPLAYRLRSLLAKLADSNGVVNETHESLAARMGTAREVVSRNLKNLAKDELVQLSRGAITIKKMDDLTNF